MGYPMGPLRIICDVLLSSIYVARHGLPTWYVNAHLIMLNECSSKRKSRMNRKGFKLVSAPKSSVPFPRGWVSLSTLQRGSMRLPRQWSGERKEPMEIIKASWQAVTGRSSAQLHVFE